MALTLYCLGILSLIELLLSHTFIWHNLRKPLAAMLIVTLSLVTGYLVGSHLRIWTILLLILSIYRIINLLRILKDRQPFPHMLHVWRRTSLYLIVSQLLVIIITVWLYRYLGNPFATWLTIFRGLELFFALALLLITWRHIHRLTIRHLGAETSWPDLSVAIPARNETDSLRDCIVSLLESDYPKLEILVLDDRSQDKHTPEIIKSFAHDGVLFLEGKAPPKNWLAKNYAYQQLLDASNGELVLFCGADCRFTPNSLRSLVRALHAQKADMVSVMPLNHSPATHQTEAALLQPIRYGWELCLPFSWLRRPPVLSTCWLATRELLLRSGDFRAVKRTVPVEAYFAKAAARASDYRFLASNREFGIASEKDASSQRETAIRTRYPQTHHRLEIVAGLSLIELTVLTVPYVLVVQALISRNWLGTFLSVLSALLITIVYAWLLKLTYNKRPRLRRLWLSLILGLYDTALLNYSMWQYEFGEVLWKGRDIAGPLTCANVPAAESSGSRAPGSARI